MYKISNIAEDISKEVFVRIYDSSGQLRWVLPKKARGALFLKLYSVSTYKQVLKRTLIYLCLKFGVYPKKYFKLGEMPAKMLGVVSNKFNDAGGQYCICAGTPGIDRKYVIYSETGDKKRYLKIPCNELSERLIVNEIRWLTYLQEENIRSEFGVPEGVLENGVLCMEAVSGVRSKGFKSYADLVKIHNFYLEGIGRQELGEYLRSLDYGSIHKTYLLKLNKYLEKIRGRWQCKDTHLMVTMAHGDLTPWNVLSRSGAPYIIDWERAESRSLYMYDYIYYITSNEILINRNTDVDGIYDIILNFSINLNSDWNGQECHELYILLNIYTILLGKCYLASVSDEKFVQQQWFYETLTLLLESKLD